MALTRILLVRHGDVPGIEPERFRGRADLPLTELGWRQAAATAQWVRQHWQPAALYTSPLRRCVQTGSVIAEASGLSAQALPALLDLDYGEWQGRSCEEVRNTSPADYQRWRCAPQRQRFPGGESLSELEGRVVQALQDIMQRHGGATVLIVAHDSTNRVSLLWALGLSLAAYWRLVQSPCAISELEADDALIRVRRMNETAHLELLHPSA